MFNSAKKYIVYLLLFFGVNSVVIAEDLFFDDFEQGFDEWSDDSDIFGGEIIQNEKNLSWLNLGISQKWGFDPSNNYSKTQEMSELTLGTSGLVYDSAYGEFKIKATKYWPIESEYYNKESKVELDSAFLQFSFDKWSTQLGLYTIGWGELEGGALDVVNPTDGMLGASIIAQWFISATRYLDNADLSLFYNANPAITKSPLDALKNDTYDEFGVRYGVVGEGGDFAFYAGQLVPNEALINLTDGFVYAKPYQLLGFTANKAFDSYLIKFDIAYKHNLQQNRPEQFIEVDRIDWDLAFVWQNDNRQLSIAINSQYLLDYFDDYLTPAAPLGNFSTDKNAMTYMASLSDKFGDSDWSWILSNVTTSNNNLSFTSAGLVWDINDNWQALLGASYANAKTDGAFSLLDDYQRFNLELTYQY